MTVKALRAGMDNFEFLQWMYFYGGAAPSSPTRSRKMPDDAALLAQFPELEQFKEG